MSPQSYYLGGKIRASDFNNFADQMNEIVGLGAGVSGYGQDQLMVSYVQAGAKIRAANWDELLTSMHFAALHQGTNILSPTSSSDVGFPSLNDPISIVPTLVNDIANIRANKLNYDISKMSIDTNKISSSAIYTPPEPADENQTWQGAHYEFRTTFVDADARRNFFNAGGEIRIVSQFAPTSDDSQSLSWEGLLDNISTIKIGINTTEASIGIEGSGFNELVNNLYSTVYQKINTATDYTDNQVLVQAKLHSTNAVDVKIQFVDSHMQDTGTSEGVSWVGSDYVSGSLTVTISQQRADDNDSSSMGVVSPIPTYSHLNELLQL